MDKFNSKRIYFKETIKLFFPRCLYIFVLESQYHALIKLTLNFVKQSLKKEKKGKRNDGSHINIKVIIFFNNKYVLMISFL